MIVLLQMPVMDGYAAISAIRALSPRLAEVPILALTASAMPDDVKHCLDAGMDAHIPKPIEVHPPPIFSLVRVYIVHLPVCRSTLSAAAFGTGSPGSWRVTAATDTSRLAPRAAQLLMRPVCGMQGQSQRRRDTWTRRCLRTTPARAHWQRSQRCRGATRANAPRVCRQVQHRLDGHDVELLSCFPLTVMGSELLVGFSPDSAELKLTA